MSSRTAIGVHINDAANMKFLVIVLALMSVAWQSADAVKCYQCNSGTSDTCESGYAKGSTCTGATCSKVIGTLQGVSVVIRDCSPASVQTSCTDYNVAGVTGKVCFCSTDLCNSATSVSFSGLMVGLVALAVTKAIVG